MSRDEIMKLSPDELRVAIAKARGWERKLINKGAIKPIYGWFMRPDDYFIKEIPDWPTDIAAALGLAEEAMEEPYEQIFTLRKAPAFGPKWICEIGIHRIADDTAPIAISRAYLMWKQP